jgi:hypothetical protein
MYFGFDMLKMGVGPSSSHTWVKLWGTIPRRIKKGKHNSVYHSRIRDKSIRFLTLTEKNTLLKLGVMLEFKRSGLSIFNEKNLDESTRNPSKITPI